MLNSTYPRLVDRLTLPSSMRPAVRPYPSKRRIVPSQGTWPWRG